MVLQPSVVQASPSSQFFATCWQPRVALQESAVQALVSSQLVGPPGTQEPPPQVSPVVQALLSLHATVFGVNTHAPVLGLHELLVQMLPSSQLFGAPGTHCPEALQESESVQALASLQSVPLKRFEFVH